MLAVLSDVHANIEALEAVLADAAGQGATCYASLGDLIGFNGDPAACVRRLAPLLSVAVRGNHEQALLHRGLFGVEMFTRMMDLTGAMLPKEAVESMRSLPFMAEDGAVSFVHASPLRPERWPRLSSVADAAQAFGAFTGQICFFGHTHRACIFREKGGTVSRLPTDYGIEGVCRLNLEPGARYLINPGSVGQPRDRDPRSAYALYDARSARVVLRRVCYDIESACPKINRTGLPSTFADALRRGESPV